MNAKPVTVVAIIKAKPGMEAELRQILLDLVPTTRREAGCLNYDFHESADQPGLFVFHENWTTKAHLDDHLARPHLKAFMAKAPELVAEPPQVLLLNKVA